MKRAEYIELTLICVVALIAWLSWRAIPSCLTLGETVLVFSGLLLAQSLVRDVSIILRKRNLESKAPAREVQCFCLESVVGSTGVIAGAALMVLASSHQLCFNQSGFTAFVTGTAFLSFLIKDLVITWNPLGIRREPDHLNVIVRWRGK